MDFVVLGFGIGALTVLIGLTARDFGPHLLALRREADQRWPAFARSIRLAAACRSGGLLLTILGGVICLMTLIALLAAGSDDTANRIVGITALLLSVTFVFWAIVFVMWDAIPASVKARAEQVADRLGQRATEMRQQYRARQSSRRTARPRAVPRPRPRRAAQPALEATGDDDLRWDLPVLDEEQAYASSEWDYPDVEPEPQSLPEPEPEPAPSVRRDRETAEERRERYRRMVNRAAETPTRERPPVSNQSLDAARSATRARVARHRDQQTSTSTSRSDLDQSPLRGRGR